MRLLRLLTTLGVLWVTHVGAADSPATPDRLNEVFAAPSDPAEAIEMDLGGGWRARVAPDRLLVWLRRGESTVAIGELASRLGGRVVGQAPQLGFYQIELTSSGASELSNAFRLAESEPVVERVTYDFVLDYSQACPPRSDIDSVPAAGRCMFESIDYHNALTLVEAARDHVAFHDVYVAVIDTGIEMENGEFDDVRVINMLDPDLPLVDLAHRMRIPGHGTQVAGIIAADNDGAGVNGITTRFLGERVTLLVAPHASQFALAYVMMERAAMMGADVVNYSATMPGPAIREGSVPAPVRSLRAAWKELFEGHPEILFVLAAGNDGLEVDQHTRLPAGIKLANVITVGGTVACEPTSFSRDSNHGPRVEIIAPGEGLPVVGFDDGHAVRLDRGTSFAAPQVTALAAILRSIDPSSSAAQLKIDLLVHPVPMIGSREEGTYLTSRLSMTESIARVLDRLPAPAPVSDWVDPHGIGLIEAPGNIVSRICGGLSLEVASEGSARAQPGDVNGVIREDGSNIYADFEGGELERLYVHAEEPLRLDAYDIQPDAAPGSVSLRMNVGRAFTGSFALHECRITMRHPINHTPIMLSLSGEFEGTLRDLLDGSPHAFEGRFGSIAFAIDRGLLAHPVLDHYEANCEGGMQYSEDPR